MEKRTELELLDIVAKAWTDLDATDLVRYIHPKFQYDSQAVFRPMYADEYPSYIKGKFETIRNTNSAPTVAIVDDGVFGDKMVKLVQGTTVGYLRIKEKDGLIVKMDMCLF